MQEEADIEKLPEAIPKPQFTSVAKLKDKVLTKVVFDIETTGLR